LSTIDTTPSTSHPPFIPSRRAGGEKEGNPSAIVSPSPASLASIRRTLSAHQQPHAGRSTWQIVVSFASFIALCALMYVTLDISTWLTLALAVPAAGFVVRIFILQHDCGHGALFRSKALNDWVGRLCGLVTLTPYANWRRQHLLHHANWNNLDRRESGADIYSTCLTTAEYRALPRRERLLYRLLRHPLVALVLLPPLVFLALYRLPFDTPQTWRRERLSVHGTNLALIALFTTLGLTLGFGAVALVQLPIMVVAAIIGVWLFSVQHRFEGTRWFRRDDWSAPSASLRGTSFLRLPGLLRWFTGNIGYHHVHHLNARIPNYRLAECHDASPALRQVPTLSLGAALRSSALWLWDEERGRMVSFAEARAAAGSRR
jgi:omega-6 fatty acid desaturase (delta-12 desaturase)